MVKFIDKKFIITRKLTPKKGDLMLCFAHGLQDRESGEYAGRGYYLHFHDDKPSSRLNAICVGTQKVVFLISFKRN